GPVVGPVERLPVVRHKHLESKYISRPFFKKLSDGEKVAFRLRHLAAFDLQEAVVHPEIRHDRRMEGATRLRDLVLVVRKDEIDAASMDVELMRMRQALLREAWLFFFP